MVKYCNYEAFLKLKDKLFHEASSGSRDAREDIAHVRGCIVTCCEYIKTVDETEYVSSAAKYTEEMQYAAQIANQQDKSRHFAHEAAIVNVRMLNRICDAYQVDKVFVGNESDRYEIGHFCGEFANMIFRHRTL